MNPIPITPQRAFMIAPLVPASLIAARSLLPDTNNAWTTGAIHPLADPAHLLALLLVGLVAALLGGRSRWGLPLMYIALTGFGMVLGAHGADVPRLDTIALTAALCLALLILGRVHLLFATVASVAGAAALFEGVADGAGVGVSRADLSFLSGLATTTVLILTGSVVLGEWIHRSHTAWSEHLHHLLAHFHGFRLRG